MRDFPVRRCRSLGRVIYNRERQQQQRGKQRSPIWVTEDEALELLSKEDDKEVIKQMAGLLRVKKNWEQLRDERDY